MQLTIGRDQAMTDVIEQQDAGGLLGGGLQRAAELQRIGGVGEHAQAGRVHFARPGQRLGRRGERAGDRGHAGQPGAGAVRRRPGQQDPDAGAG
jgi:hypothetical protein